MSAPEVSRRDLAQPVLERARQGPPLLLTGPPGAGKTTLLLALTRSLADEGWVAVYLDLMGAVSSPDRFVTAALDAMPAAAFGRHLPRAAELRRAAGAGRQSEAEAVRGLLDLWAGLDEANGRPVALLLDEATEIRSLAYFSGLRDVDQLLGAALASRRRGTILATSFPTLAARSWSFENVPLPPFTSGELRAVLSSLRLQAGAESLLAASFGWPRYVRILVERLALGDGLPAAWADEMTAGGRLELACRSTYETLLLRSRGYGMSKAVLGAVAQEEGLNLTALVSRLGRTPGATRDYLHWLVGVDALRMVHKRYHYVDGLLRLWVRLHARGTPPARPELLAAMPTPPDAETTPTPQDNPSEVEAPLPRRRESLIEID